MTARSYAIKHRIDGHDIRPIGYGACSYVCVTCRQLFGQTKQHGKYGTVILPATELVMSRLMRASLIRESVKIRYTSR